MKTRLLIILALAIIPIMDISFAEELEIKFEETVSHDGLKLYFYDVEDSRCPSDVTCIWEGKVSAMIHISNQTHKIGGPHGLNTPLTFFEPYKIILLDVSPIPISTEKTDYVATLEITNTESKYDEFTDEDICGEENILVDGICRPTEFFRVYDPDFSRQILQTGETISNPEVILIIESLGAGLIVLFIIIYAIRKRKK